MEQRHISHVDSLPLQAYDLEGLEQLRLIRWLPIRYDRATGCGSYYFQMLPGAVTTPHRHPRYEEFFVVDGEAIESDGTVLRAGDFISFAPDTEHFTRSETGCLLIVVEWLPDANRFGTVAPRT
ncbi:MAG TPA: cupin domain-containing protein [Dongiaceae bacterium]|nr:cupin domain-containing protein [Dongiaceae bacterium]